MDLSKPLLIFILSLAIVNQVNTTAFFNFNTYAIKELAIEKFEKEESTIWASQQTNGRIPIDELDTDGDGSVLLSKPGHYYLRDTLVVTKTSGDGIIIDSDNVILDLNGFAVIAGPQQTDDGIVVQGTQENITIKNGSVIGFGGDGINGLVADLSSFENLLVKDNGDDGISTDFSCLVINCIVLNNGSEGINVDDGSIVRNCTSGNNGADGIRASLGCIVYNCIAFGNASHGIDVNAGSRIEHCTVYDNHENGLDLGTSVLTINNTAYRNGWNGIRTSNNALILDNISNDNGTCISDGSCGVGTNGQGSNEDQGAGILANSNAMVLKNTSSGNYFGLVLTGVDITANKNNVQNNSHAGILATNFLNLIIKNSAENNGFQQSPSITNTSTYPLGNIVFSSGDFEGSSVGPIINVYSAGDISTISGAGHPFANFIY